MSDMLLNQFSQLNHQDKYDKLMVYLHAAQKSDENFIGIYGIVDVLGVDGIDEDLLVELYSAFLDLVEYDSQERLGDVIKHLKHTVQLKQKESNERKFEINTTDTLISNL